MVPKAPCAPKKVQRNSIIPLGSTHNSTDETDDVLSGSPTENRSDNGFETTVLNGFDDESLFGDEEPANDIQPSRTPNQGRNTSADSDTEWLATGVAGNGTVRPSTEDEGFHTVLGGGHSHAEQLAVFHPVILGDQAQAQLNRVSFPLHIAGTPGGDEIEFGRGKAYPEDCAENWKLYWSYHDVDKSDESTWPPANVILQDWHILKIVEAGLFVKDRQRWKADFAAEGWVRLNRKPKGRAAKIKDGTTNHYVVLGGVYQLQGDEGGLFPYHKAERYDKGSKVKVSLGDVCRIQDDFVPHKIELEGGTFMCRYPAGEAPRQKKATGKSDRKRKRSGESGADGAPEKKHRVEVKVSQRTRLSPHTCLLTLPTCCASPYPCVCSQITPSMRDLETSPLTMPWCVHDGINNSNDEDQIDTANPPASGSGPQGSHPLTASIPQVQPIVMSSRRTSLRTRVHNAADFYAQELAGQVLTDTYRNRFVDQALTNISDGLYAASRMLNEDEANAHLTGVVRYIAAVRVDLNFRANDDRRAIVDRGTAQDALGFQAFRDAINRNYRRPTYPTGLTGLIMTPGSVSPLDFSVVADTTDDAAAQVR